MEVLIYGGKWKSVSEKLVEIKTEISQMENNLNICGFLLHKIGRAHIEVTNYENFAAIQGCYVCGHGGLSWVGRMGTWRSFKSRLPGQ